MRHYFIFLFLFVYLVPQVFSQVTFAVVCNPKENKTMVIVSDRQTSEQTLLRDNFPNRAVAESWMLDNYPKGTCIALPASQTQSMAAQPSGNSSTQAQSAASPKIRRGGVTYSRFLTLRVGLSPMLNADTYYPNIQGGAKNGFNVGGELMAGKQVKWGGGFYYSRLVGGLDNQDFGVGEAAYLEALKGRFLIKAPFRVGKNAWLLLNFYVNYYFEPKLSNGESLTDADPLIEKDFGGLGGGLGLDFQRIVIGADFESIYNVFDQEGEGNLNMLDFYVGFAL